MKQTDTPKTPPNSGHDLVKIVGVMVVLLVLVNLPLNVFGSGLAHLIPQRPAIAIENGMLLRGDDPTIYLVDNFRLRPLSGPEVHRIYFHSRPTTRVDDSILSRFEQGPPVRRWLRCDDSVYALENNQKRLCTAACNLTVTKAASQRRPWDQLRPYACKKLDAVTEGPPLTEAIDF